MDNVKISKSGDSVVIDVNGNVMTITNATGVVVRKVRRLILPFTKVFAEFISIAYQTDDRNRNSMEFEYASISEVGGIPPVDIDEAVISISNMFAGSGGGGTGLTTEQENYLNGVMNVNN